MLPFTTALARPCTALMKIASRRGLLGSREYMTPPHTESTMAMQPTHMGRSSSRSPL